MIKIPRTNRAMWVEVSDELWVRAADWLDGPLWRDPFWLLRAFREHKKGRGWDLTIGKTSAGIKWWVQLISAEGTDTQYDSLHRDPAVAVLRVVWQALKGVKI